jgi:methyl-branched lipid omega-hydroxylase
MLFSFVGPGPRATRLSRVPTAAVAIPPGGDQRCGELARLEATTMLRELLTRLPGVRAVGEPEPLLSSSAHGVERMRFAF